MHLEKSISISTCQFQTLVILVDTGFVWILNYLRVAVSIYAKCCWSIILIKIFGFPNHCLSFRVACAVIYLKVCANRHWRLSIRLHCEQ